jgi:rubrerythrin
MIEKHELKEKIGEIAYRDLEKSNYGVVFYTTDEKYSLPKNIEIGKEYRITSAFFENNDILTIKEEAIYYSETKYVCSGCRNEPLFQSNSEPYCPVCGEPKESNAPDCS